MENVQVATNFNEKEFFKDFHKELEEIELEIEEENKNNIFKTFIGNPISIQKFEQAMSNNAGESMNIEMFFNENLITSQWYDILAVEDFGDRLVLDDECGEVPSVDIFVEDINEILEGKGYMDGHYLVKLHGGFEYFLYEGLS